MITNSEEFFASPTTILRQVFEFIGLHQVGNEMLQAFTSDVYNQRLQGAQPSLLLSDADREELSSTLQPSTHQPLKLERCRVEVILHYRG